MKRIAILTILVFLLGIAPAACGGGEEGTLPPEGWCCFDGDVFPASESECAERGGHFFPTQEEAEDYCRGEMPPEGWCCFDGEVFPSSESECAESGGHFFPTQEEAEDYCRGEMPSEGWCCFDNEVFLSSEPECVERGGRFFPTQEEAEDYYRGEMPSEGWCCFDNEVFPSSEPECVERGGRFFPTQGEAEDYCRGQMPPEVPLPHEYPSVPTANLDVENAVPMSILEKIADADAFEIWGENIARGQPFPVADETGDVFAYVFPYIRGSNHFPKYEEIFDRVRQLRANYQELSEAEVQPSFYKMPTEFYNELRQTVGEFGSIYVSATSTNFPILRASHFLHPYFLVGDLAQQEANRHFDGDEVRLDRLYFLGPHEEYFEFTSREDSILIHVNSHEEKTPEEVLVAEPRPPLPPEMMREIEDIWERATELTPIGIDADDISGTHTTKLIPYWKLVPVVDWTWWCVPTAATMVVGFWDNYFKGTGTITGYGRLIDYWFEHSSGNNVPNFIDEMIDPKTKSWRKRPDGTGYKDLGEFITETQNYNFSYPKVTATSSNDWAWSTLKGQIDSGSPAVWSVPAGVVGIQGHSMTAFGYRTTSTGQKFVIVYNTWGKTAEDQKDEYNYAYCSGVDYLLPGGGTDGHHLIITSPDGGETLNRLMPTTISWFVWGNKIKKTTISFSTDGGNNWTPIASNLNAKTGWNSYLWVPEKATTKGRVRIQGYTEQNEYIAGDGSQKNFTVAAVSFNNWGSWVSLGKPLTGNYGIESIAVGHNEDGRLEIFAIGSDSALWHTHQTKPNQSTWSGWSNLGTPTAGTALSRLAVGQNEDGRLEVFAIDSDGSLWHTYQPKPGQGPWSGWASLGTPTGGIALYTLAVGQNKDGRLEVFAIGSNGSLWHTYQPKPGQGPWSDWASLGTPTVGVKLYTLAVEQNKDGRLEVFAGGGSPGKGEFGLTNVALWHRYQTQPNQTSWSGWTSLSTPTTTTSSPYPVVGQNKDGRLEVFAVGSDGALWHTWQPKPNHQGPWGAWMKLGGTPPGGTKLLSLLAVGKNKDWRMEVFAIGMSIIGSSSVTVPLHIWQVAPNDGWSIWGGLSPLAGKTLDSLAVEQNKDGRLEVFAIAVEDHSLWHITQK